MNLPATPTPELEQRLATRLLDVLIRAGLIVALAMLSYRIFAPFLTLMLWSLILAVMLYPLHQMLARRLGNRQGLTATLLVIVFIALIVVPVAILMGSFGDVLQQFVNNLRSNALEIPPPRPGVATWPLIGERAYALWTQAHADLPALLQQHQTEISTFTKAAVGVVASIGIGLLQFIGAIIIAGIMMAFGEAGARSCRAIFCRITGPAHGNAFADLSTQTVRAVALGVIGIALIQAILVGGALLIAGVPLAGVLAVIVLVLGIAQIPAVIVILPAIAYLWVGGGDYTTTAAIGYSVMLALTGTADNILKPLLLGRGVDAPMPVILLGALGGMATSGILGMFVGATLLALAYQLFVSWVDDDPDAIPAEPLPASQPPAPPPPPPPIASAPTTPA